MLLLRHYLRENKKTRCVKEMKQNEIIGPSQAYFLSLREVVKKNENVVQSSVGNFFLDFYLKSRLQAGTSSIYKKVTLFI